MEMLIKGSISPGGYVGSTPAGSLLGSDLEVVGNAVDVVVKLSAIISSVVVNLRRWIVCEYEQHEYEHMWMY